jgi:hypothetical protein
MSRQTEKKTLIIGIFAEVFMALLSLGLSGDSFIEYPDLP